MNNLIIGQKYRTGTRGYIMGKYVEVKKEGGMCKDCIGEKGKYCGELPDCTAKLLIPDDQVFVEVPPCT